MVNINNIQKLFKIIKITLWLIPAVLFIWILSQHFVLSGKLEIKYNVSEDSKFVRNFASKELDRLIGSINKPGEREYFQIITKSPVYFDIKVPRPFQKAIVSLKYQNPSGQPDIKLGVKQANEAFYYQDMAFWISILENLPDYWDKIQENDLILLQKNKKYLEEKELKQEELDKSFEEQLKRLKIEFEDRFENKTRENEYELKRETINIKYQKEVSKMTVENKVKVRPKPEFSSVEEFLKKFPDPMRVLQYNYNLSNQVELPHYLKSNKSTEINKSIRGKHEIYTYIGKDEDLNFTFTVQDINRHLDKDIFKVVIYNNKGEKIKEEFLPDDGEDSATGIVSQERTLQIMLKDIPFGTYRLVIDANDDLFIKKIITFQHLLMFKGNIYLTDNEEYKDILGDKKLKPTTLFTDASFIQTRTAHKNGLQKLRIDTIYQNKHLTQELDINIRHELVKSEELGDITQITIPKNDVYIEGNGFFTFSKDQFFALDLGVTNLLNIENIDEFDYIITSNSYPKAKREGDWLVATTIVETPNLYFHKNQDTMINFIFSLPGLPENNRILKIKEVNIQFEKEPITIKNFFLKLKDWAIRNLKILKK